MNLKNIYDRGDDSDLNNHYILFFKWILNSIEDFEGDES